MIPALATLVPAAIAGLGAAPTLAGIAAPAGAGSFGAALQRALTSVADTAQQADRAGAAALAGNGSITDAVLALSRADMALQAVAAVRDRAVQAYQEVARSLA